MNRLKRDLRVGVLGAIGGLFSISLFLLVARVDAYYLYLSRLNDAEYGHFYSKVEDLWWIPVAFWQVLLSVVASLLVHRYIRNAQKSPFLTWQAIGTIALIGWVLTFSVVFGLDFLMKGAAMSWETLVGSDPKTLTVIAKYVSAVFAANVFYGSLIQSSSQLYGQQESSLIQANFDKLEAGSTEQVLCR